MDDDTKEIADAFRAGWRPEPLLTVSEWADKHRILSGGAEPGRWRTSRTPYLREIMDCLSPSSPIQDITVMKGTQVGFSEAGNNWIGFVMHHAPGPMLVVQTTATSAEAFSSQRIDAMIETCPELSKLISGRMERDQRNTLLYKEFPGGVLKLTGGKNSTGLRSMMVRYLYLDEVDTYLGDISGEGDPVAVASRRTSTFTTRRKIYKISSPTVHGVSRIEREFERTDKRYYHVPCVHCQHMFVLKWELIRWDNDDPTTTRLVCPSCGGEMHERHKPAMLAGGEWRPTAEAEHPLVRGYHLSGLYSPWRTWEDEAREFIGAKHDRERLKSWVNSCLGETWVERGDAPEWERLYERREHGWQTGVVPSGAMILTCGVDVQRDRLEAYVWGWGPGLESWMVDYATINGSPEESDTWADLDSLLARRWPRADGGSLRIERLAIDTGDGMYTHRVYSWCRQQDPYRVMAVKGVLREGAGAPLSVSEIDIKDRGRTIRRGLRLWTVNVGGFKSETYQWLRLPVPEDGDEYPAGFVHLPLGTSSEVCKQLCAETLVPQTTRGMTKMIWHQSGPNEALDCRVYARACIYALGADAAGDRFWSHARAATDATPHQRHVTTRPPPARGGRSYVGDFGRMR